MKFTSVEKKMFAMTAVAVTWASVATAQNSICAIYPTRCTAYSGPRPVGPLGLAGYPGNSPIYTPEVLAPAMGMVVRNALNGLPPAVRQQLYPAQAAAAVRSGAVDRAVDQALRSGFDPYARIINGTGPGGAAYTNQAAAAVMNGTSPIWKLGAAQSPYTSLLARPAQAARAQQNALKLHKLQQTLYQLQLVLKERQRQSPRLR